MTQNPEPKPAAGGATDSRRARRATIAMLLVGMAIFSGLYSTQALLPVLVASFELTSTQAALTVSAATGGLALCVIPASILSERFGRGRVLLLSMLAAVAVGLIVPLAATPWQLIALRFVQGAAMAGAPATAMTWLSEELDGAALPKAMGIYIAGNSCGGLVGRLVPLGVVELTSWRGAILACGAVGLAFALLAWALLPAQRNFRPKEIRFRQEARAVLRHWRNGRLAILYVLAFLSMGTFVSFYNFVGFRLTGHFHIAPLLAGLVFLFYLSGTWSAARAGSFIRRFGHRRVLQGSGALMAAGALFGAGPLPLLIGGLVLFTAGFFALHSTASSWVGAIASHDRAEASSMYVFCYYLGSSLVGAATGWAFGVLTWAGFVGLLATLAGLATLLATKISD